MSKKQFLVEPRVVEEFSVYIDDPFDPEHHKVKIQRIDGAWEDQDFYEFVDIEQPKGKDPLVSVICPHDPDKWGSMKCSIFARNSVIDPLYTLTVDYDIGKSRVATFPSIVKTVTEARKLVPAVLKGNLRDSEEFYDLRDELFS